MTSEPLQKNPEGARGIEKREVPVCRGGTLEAYWTRVLERVKTQSEARDSKDGGAA